MLFFIIFNPTGAGALSRDFIINMSLQVEKVKSPTFPGPAVVGVSNDWCIIECSKNNTVNIQTVDALNRQRKMQDFAKSVKVIEVSFLPLYR